MKEKKSVVILYSKGLYDTNAMQLASAITKAENDCHVIAIGDDKYTNLGKGKLTRRSYVFSIRNARWMYGLFSKMTAKTKAPEKELKNIKADPVERTGLNKLMYDLTSRFYKVKNILRRYEPEIVLCFTPEVLNHAIKANEQLRMYTTKIYACVSDFGFDMRFFNRRCSGYIVQNEEIKQKLISLGLEANKTYVTSLISTEFKTYDKAEVKSEIGIRNDKPCVLLVAGRYGGGIMKNALNYLMNYTDNFNIVLLSGGSNTLVSVAKHIADGAGDSVFVIDEIDDIAKAYTVADLVVSAPTTCICAEALSLSKPLILLRPVGQVEKNNAKYLISHSYAYDGFNKEKLLVAISDVILNGSNGPVGFAKYVEIGSLQALSDFLMGRATDIFEEKKILLAEQKLQDATDIDDYLIDEIEEVKNNSVSDDAIIDEYNDIEEK